MRHQREGSRRRGICFYLVSSLATYTFTSEYEYILNPFQVFIKLFMKRNDILEAKRERNVEKTKNKLKIRERKHCGF